MGLMNWFTPSRRSLARAQIEGSLKAWKVHGFFDGDPAASAKAVEDFSAPRLPKAMMDSMNPTVLAVSWLVSFVSGNRAPRDQLMPFASAGLGLLRMATAPDSKLAPWEQNIAERALVELSAFVDASSINLNVSSGSSQRDAVPIDGPNSMSCILAERSYLDARYGAGSWQLINQASIQEAGRFYDRLIVATPQGGETAIWFDLTESRGRWTVEGNVKALSNFKQVASGAATKYGLEAARKIITECLDRLNYPAMHSSLESYLPINETVVRLTDYANSEKLNAEELALLLIDAGMADQKTAAVSAKEVFGEAFHTVLGEGSKDMAQSLADAGLARHDRLLTEVFKRASEKGTLLVPQYGSAGAAMKSAVGTLIEPLTLPEKQNTNGLTPRDRDRAMTELINRMKG